MKPNKYLECYEYIHSLNMPSDFKRITLEALDKNVARGVKIWPGDETCGTEVCCATCGESINYSQDSDDGWSDYSYCPHCGQKISQPGWLDEYYDRNEKEYWLERDAEEERQNRD